VGLCVRVVVLQVLAKQQAAKKVVPWHGRIWFDVITLLVAWPGTGCSSPATARRMAQERMDVGPTSFWDALFQLSLSLSRT